MLRKEKDSTEKKLPSIPYSPNTISRKIDALEEQVDSLKGGLVKMSSKFSNKWESESESNFISNSTEQ